ncbi:hypothetical protein XELAEV_18005230mg [Xenopus laevis]|uniref:Secreted protein n=1 Tax=Xenopus laevis TaxID=8355 RepID=A0A974DWI7_XENLA|nr:hypothetical protein XELAEV_18005230mg [Xenopus laevis]
MKWCVTQCVFILLGPVCDSCIIPLAFLHHVSCRMSFALWDFGDLIQVFTPLAYPRGQRNIAEQAAVGLPKQQQQQKSLGYHAVNILWCIVDIMYPNCLCR